MEILSKVKELLDIEKRNDIFNFTTKERAEFQAEVIERIEEYHPAVEELEKYEEAKAQGFLLMLPCKVGDTVWLGNISFSNNPRELYVHRITINENSISVHATFTNGSGIHFNLKEFGKTVFLTPEEAEQALAEKKGE